MRKDEIAKEIGGKVLMRQGMVCVVFLAAIVSFPFVWIWVGFGLAWKVGLTGVLGYIISALIYLALKKIINEASDEIIEKEMMERKTFSQRLDEMKASKGKP